MSELTREQVLERLGKVFVRDREALADHDAALRSRCEASEQECSHFRSACSSIGETDGHGWAETTKELRLQVADLTAKLAEMAEERNDLNDTRQGLEAELSEVRHLRNNSVDVSVKLQQLIESLKHDTPVPHKDLYHHKTIVEARRQRTAQQKEIGRLREVIQWAMGEHPTEDFPPREFGEGLLWWRRKLMRLYTKALAFKQDGHALPE